MHFKVSPASCFAWLWTSYFFEFFSTAKTQWRLHVPDFLTWICSDICSMLTRTLMLMLPFRDVFSNLCSWHAPDCPVSASGSDSGSNTCGCICKLHIFKRETMLVKFDVYFLFHRLSRRGSDQSQRSEVGWRRKRSRAGGRSYRHRACTKCWRNSETEAARSADLHSFQCGQSCVDAL